MAKEIDEKKLTDRERLMLRQNQERDFRHAMDMAAHDRFMERRAGFIKSNPGAVSRDERNSVLRYVNKREDEDRLRQHEKEMLQEKNAGELAVAQEKRAGMREQGADAAAQNKEAAIDAAEKQWAAQKDIAETNANAEKHKADTQAEAQKAVAATQADAQKSVAKTQADAAVDTGEQKHGYIDKDGVYHPGSDVEAAKVAAQAAKETRLEAAQARAADNARADEKDHDKLVQRYFAAIKSKHQTWTTEQILAEAEKAASRGKPSSVQTSKIS